MPRKFKEAMQEIAVRPLSKEEAEAILASAVRVYAHSDDGENKLDILPLNPPSIYPVAIHQDKLIEILKSRGDIKKLLGEEVISYLSSLVPGEPDTRMHISLDDTLEHVFGQNSFIFNGFCGKYHTFNLQKVEQAALGINPAAGKAKAP